MEKERRNIKLNITQVVKTGTNEDVISVSMYQKYTIRSTTDNWILRCHSFEQKVSDDPFTLVLISLNLAPCSPGAGTGTAIVKRAWAQLPYIIRVHGRGDILLVLLSFIQRIGKESNTVVFEYKKYCLDKDISPLGVLFLIGRFEQQMGHGGIKEILRSEELNNRVRYWGPAL